MGKRGPKPKPTALKVMAGSWRAKENPHEPMVPKGYPPKPSSFSADESALWDLLARDLYEQGLLTPSNGIALETLVRARCEEMEAENKIRQMGLLVRGPNGYPERNPYMKIRDSARKVVAQYLAAFGMTPADRTRVAAVQSVPLKVDPVTELLDQ